MISFFSKRFVKDYENYQDPDVRQRYGIFCSIISIFANIALATFKLGIGFITNSVAIQADGLNNLSDVGSNVASLFGFKLANKHPDEEHPYGHGRMEYISGLIIAFLIVVVGLQSLKEAVLKILYPDEVTFSIVACIILVVSIGIKLWMSFFNKNIGEKINSSTLKAAGQDSINDVFTTSATLVALILSLYTTLPVDGIFGVVVSLVVLKAGYEIFNETINPLLGKAPDKELLLALEAFIKSYDVAIGVHDLVMHDYGPGRRFLTVHVEVDGNSDIMNVHDSIDDIERSVLKKFHILTTIHMDPIDTNDVLTNELRIIVEDIVTSINIEYSIHDFRIVSGPTHTNLIFDVLIPASDTIEHKELKKMINERIRETHKEYFTVIQIEHGYV
jgi:cation diffusion facilitator family transporter